MFGQYFYHRMIRTYVAYFGTLFNNIECRRFDKDKNTTARFRVPLTYASRDYYRQRILGDPNLDRKPNVVLPRMGFLISGIQYDLSRKLNPLNHFRGMSAGGAQTKVPMHIPYDLNFELHIWSKTTEDGAQVVEQIIPNFQPDFTASLRLLKSADPGLEGLSLDIPLILDSVQWDDAYEQTADGVRVMVWTLGFTMRAYFFAGTKDITNSGGAIREVLVRTFGDLPAEDPAMHSEIRISPSPAAATEFEPYTITTDITRYSPENPYSPYWPTDET